ncbi:MAG: hypothetical protein PHW46_04720, partial [Candidatus Omnitrophica bacterium]|nr:hypothetical protein [Candidatus Omnitrophota bacterium]
AFLVSVDPKRLQEAKDEFVYVRLMEMLRLALQLAFKDEVDRELLKKDHPAIGIFPREGSPREFTFIPSAEPFDVDDMRDLYDAEIKVIMDA